MTNIYTDNSVVIANMQKTIDDQLLTITALNNALGGEGSLTTDNLVTLGRLEQTIDDQKALIEKMREALKPLADFADHYPMVKQYGNRPTRGIVYEVASSGKEATITVEDFHRAKALALPSEKG